MKIIRTRRTKQNELLVYIPSNRPDPALEMQLLDILKEWNPGKHLKYSNKRKCACIIFTKLKR